MKYDIKHYENEIKKLHNALIDYPENKSLNEKLSRRLSKWAGLLNITVSVASNEQIPWLESEIGYHCIPMITKQKSGYNQIGDYIFYLDDYNMFGGVVVERKGVKRENGRMMSSDLYSSFANKDNRRRFYAEFDRYLTDDRFNRFVLITECSYLEHLTYKPKFNGKNYNRTNFGMNVAARRATIAKLISMGIDVHFAGNRNAAVDLYHDLVLQWCRTHYKQILNIGE